MNTKKKKGSPLNGKISSKSNSNIRKAHVYKIEQAHGDDENLQNYTISVMSFGYESVLLNNNGETLYFESISDAKLFMKWRAFCDDGTRDYKKIARIWRKKGLESSGKFLLISYGSVYSALDSISNPISDLPLSCSDTVAVDEQEQVFFVEGNCWVTECPYFK